MDIFNRLFLFLVLCIVPVFSQQCENWVPISPDNYNNNYISINSPQANQARPLGFSKASIQKDGPGKCILVSNTAGNGRHIEVKYDFGFPNTLCLSDNMTGLAPTCRGDASVNRCGKGPGNANIVTYTFNCTGDACESGEITFWYRFVVEEEVNGTYDPDWCDKRNAQVPSSLVAPPAVPVDISIGNLPFDPNAPIKPPIVVPSVVSPSSTSSSDRADVGGVDIATVSQQDVPPGTTGGRAVSIRGTTNILVLSTLLALSLFAYQSDI